MWIHVISNYIVAPSVFERMLQDILEVVLVFYLVGYHDCGNHLVQRVLRICFVVVGVVGQVFVASVSIRRIARVASRATWSGQWAHSDEIGHASLICGPTVRHKPRATLRGE